MADNVLTEKQKLFALEYLKDLNATRAYKEVYKSCKKEETVNAASSRLLRNVKVHDYIEAELEKIKNNKIADTEEVMQYLTKVLRGESESEIVVVEGTGDGCSSARTMKKAPDEKERTKAAELLGRRYGMFTDNFKANGNMTINFVNDLEEDDENVEQGSDSS